MIDQHLPIAVIGAGPIGLAAAAHLIGRGETPIIFERGAGIAASIQEWAHVRFFSPWRYTLDKVSVTMLEAADWQSPDLGAIPTGGDIISQYLRPLADLPAIRSQLRLNTRVTAVSRYRADKLKDAGRDDMPFLVRFQTVNCDEDQLLVKAVIDASGTWTKANPLGANGLPSIGEKANAEHIVYGIPDILGSAYSRYAHQRVMVVGGGHSAINALLELGDILDRAPNTQITWVMRSANVSEAYGGLGDDELPARGKLGLRIKEMVDAHKLTVRTPFYIQKVQAVNGGLLVSGETPSGSDSITVDEIITATGFRPDFSFISELRLGLDSSLETTPTMAPMIDPNIHSCGTVRPHGERELRHPESGFYIVGMKSYGRAPTFLLATGYEQVRSVVATLVGDWQAAEQVQLELPETGVCSTDGNCCGTTSNSQIPISTISEISFIPWNGGTTSTAAVGVSSPVMLATAKSECGCGDECCADGTRSTTCGCDSACCS